MTLPSKQSRFVEEYLIDPNGKQAAIPAATGRRPPKHRLQGC
jgi:phage terminase small subunit